MNGKGKYTTPSGGVYEGEWKDGKMHGNGKYTYENGDTYEGEWREGEKNGRGNLFKSVRCGEVREWGCI